MTTPVAMVINTEPVFAKTTNNYTIAFFVPEIFQVRITATHATLPPAAGAAGTQCRPPQRLRCAKPLHIVHFIPGL